MILSAFPYRTVTLFMVKKGLGVERSLRWLLEVPSEKSGMFALGSSCREGTEEVMWYASQWEGSRKGDKLFSGLDNGEGQHRRGSRMYRSPGAHVPSKWTCPVCAVCSWRSGSQAQEK